MSESLPRHVVRRPAFAPGVLLAIVVLIGLCGAAVGAGDSEPSALVERARIRLDQAEDLGAKRYLPEWYKEAETSLARARSLVGAGDQAVPGGVRQAAEEAFRLADRLAVRAAQVKRLRERPEPWQAVVSDYEATLGRLAAAAGAVIPDSLAGPAMTRELERLLAARTTRVRLSADSLAVAYRILDERCESEIAARDSALTSAEVELSSLRRQLWQTEVRAGMAEADRTAAESDLERQRERREAIRETGADFGPDAGEVLLTPAGDVIIRVYGFGFAVGSAAMPPGGEALVAKLAAAIARFPGMGLRVEGHTDNTGSRDANLRLSRRRAETVAAALEKAAGLDPDAVEIVGHGPDFPIATNETPEGRARNRRIDVVLLAGGS